MTRTGVCLKALGFSSVSVTQCRVLKLPMDVKNYAALTTDSYSSLQLTLTLWKTERPLPVTSRLIFPVKVHSAEVQSPFVRESL